MASGRSPLASGGSLETSGVSLVFRDYIDVIRAAVGSLLAT